MGTMVKNKGLIGFLILASANLLALFFMWQFGKHLQKTDERALDAAIEAKKAADASEKAIQKAEGAILINCSFGNSNRNAMIRILKETNDRLQSSEIRTKKEKQAGQKFYERQIRGLPLFDCEALRLGVP
jgi:hypothetical protein